MLDGGGSHFAVVYSDGDREVNVGTISVDPASLSFKRLLSLLSHKVGISPHIFSVYLAAVGTDRKIPLTAQVNLASAIPPGGSAAGYYFFLVRRTSSSSRRSKKPAARDRKIQPENVVLLRRAAGESQLAALAGAAPPFMDRIGYEMRMLKLQMEREQFLLNMATNDASVGREASNAGGERHSGGGERVLLICEECLRGTDGGFHPCVNDEVTVRFRSTAGPVSRPPAKNSGRERT